MQLQTGAVRSSRPLAFISVKPPEALKAKVEEATFWVCQFLHHCIHLLSAALLYSFVLTVYKKAAFCGL